MVHGGNHDPEVQVAQLVAENERLRKTLSDIHMLALEASEEYEDSCRAKVSRIYSLSNPWRAG